MKEKPEQEKEPIDMTTDEALEYVFGPELAEELKKEAEQIGCLDSENGTN